MKLDLMKERGVPLERQTFSWRDIVREPISKLDHDAFTRVRIILMNGIESQQNRFLHAMARTTDDDALKLALARVRRTEHHQQTTVNWLLGADHSPLETTIGFEQVAVEVTAAVAKAEPDAYLAQVHRFGLLEDFDHLYRFSALMDRMEGKDANAILQGYSDVVPGRPTIVEHRHPQDDLRDHYDRAQAKLVTKLHAYTILAGENQTRDYYMTIGPMFADPLARQLYAEIASIEEQHVTQYESIIDPNETWMEKWLLHEANEVYNYLSCLESESDPQVRALWQQFLDYELGQLAFVRDLYESREQKDAAELLGDGLPAPLPYTSQREFVRETLLAEVGFRAQGKTIGDVDESAATLAYRSAVHARGCPSEAVAAGYRFTPGTELAKKGATP
jgi:hypothetical protein